MSAHTPIRPGENGESNGIKPSVGFDWYRLLPPFWIQNDRTCRAWDAALNRALDQYGACRVDGYTCKVGPLEVWTANWPYSYGNSYRPKLNVLPMVRTRLRLRKMLGEEYDLRQVNRLAALVALVEQSK